MARRKPPVDEVGARRALRASVDRIAAEHPELVGSRGSPATDADTWTATLEGAVKDADKSKQVAFRLPASLLERLDRYAVQLEREQRGMTVNRTDVVRILLTRGLDDAEARRKG